ncbi:MAG: TetR/AcrR family transcriptional regulator [Deltaproteobacteria bacterium]|nr:MAG: TetR/AcrR family transcriptional regulator [Deltaproteobacteria bacterium]
MGRREEKKQQKRDAIGAAGLSLFLEHGYERASIEQIAAQAGIARGTFYLYYATKLELFEALADTWFRPLLALLEGVQGRLSETTTRADSYAIYQEMALELAVLGLSNEQGVMLAFRESRSAHEAGEAVRRRELELQAVSTRLTQVGAERGLITAPNPRLASLIIIGAIERLYFEFLAGADGLGDPMKLAGDAVALLGRMLDLPTDLAEMPPT